MYDSVYDNVYDILGVFVSIIHIFDLTKWRLCGMIHTETQGIYSKEKNVTEPKPCEMITKGVRKAPKPDHMTVCLPPGFRRCWLAVTDGRDICLLPISKAVAEALIADGMDYQGHEWR